MFIIRSNVQRPVFYYDHSNKAELRNRALVKFKMKDRACVRNNEYIRIVGVLCENIELRTRRLAARQ